MVGIPLAWLQLYKSKGRLLAAIAGIAFASLLMLTHMGVSDALFDSAVLLHHRLNGEIVIVSKQYQFLIRSQSFTKRRLEQARAVDGIASVAPLYLGMAPWTNPWSRQTRDVFIVGFEPRPGILDVPGLDEYFQKLRRPDTALFDELSRAEFGPVDEAFRAGDSVDVQVGPRKLRIAGLFSMGTSFGVDGSLLTSDLNFLRVTPGARDGLVGMGIVKLQSDADAEAVRSQLATLLPDDVDVMSREALIKKEVDYWAGGTPIGFTAFLGVAMGWIVGAVIVYQILSSDVSEHLQEYATLKAMGYTNAYLFGVVMQEAFIISILGFIPSLFLVQIVYAITHAQTLLPIGLTLERSLTVYGYTLVMCSLSGALAARRLRSADPASIF